MPTAYVETAVQVKPITKASCLSVLIPRKNGEYLKRKHTSTTSFDLSDVQNEQTYSEHYLASASALYFRSTKTYPRSFLWRVVGKQKILEIQPADVTRPEKDTNEAHFTLRFQFQDPILPLGVSFADPINADEIHAFIGTVRGEVFNLRLSTSSFRSGDLPERTTDWCRPIDVSSFSINDIYHVYASSPFEVFVAFESGRISVLRRKSDSEIWQTENLNDATWGQSIRGLVSRGPREWIEYKSRQLSLKTVQAMVAAPDGTYLYTLCLNHTLRIWHLPSGKLVEQRDLLDRAVDPNERVQLSPAEPGLLRFVKHPKGKHPVLVTYTPHEGGQFKFWNVKGGLTDPLTIEDRYPNVKLSPPDPDPTGNTIWSLTGFEVIPGTEFRHSQIWVLWRNNNYHQVYSLHFDFPTLSDVWRNHWVQTAARSVRPESPGLAASNPQDVTSKWLEFLLFPERYTDAVLETALARYEEITTSTTRYNPTTLSLSERLCSVVAASVSLRKYDTSEMDYERFNIDTDYQWRSFWRILESINDKRYAPLSMSYDVFADQAWITMTDACTAIRECSKIELLQNNPPEAMDSVLDILSERWPHRKVGFADGQQANIATILEAARTFRASFGPDLVQEFADAVEAELYLESNAPTADRIVLLFNQVNSSDGLSEGAEDQLLKDLGPVSGVLSTDLISFILGLLTPSSKRPKSTLRNTIFGSALLTSGLSANIQSSRCVLLDMLVLTIFIDETDIFNPSNVFEQIIPQLKEQERSMWLISHTRRVPLTFLGQSSKPKDIAGSGGSVQNYRSVHILEDIFTKSVRPQPAVERSTMYLLTDMITETVRWISGRDAVTPEDAAIHIQCDLLVHGNIDLAAQFLKFQPSTPWAEYVKARLRLARKEYAGASVYFEMAAYTLACGKAIGDPKEMSAGLLSVLDAQHFNNGLPSYYQHVMELFESEHAYAQAAQFANLALKEIKADAKKHSTAFKSEIYSRLFTAELKSGRFNPSFEALLQFSDRALQKSSTTALVNAILDVKTSATGSAGALSILRSLPWSSHPDLSEYLDQHLGRLAKSQTSIPDRVSHPTASTTMVDYLSILYAWRLSKDDFRGAASVLFDRLRLIQRSGRARSDPQATALRHALLALINIFTSISREESYIIVDAAEDPRRKSLKRAIPNEDHDGVRARKRVIITLEDLRREYQQVLDKCARIETGDFDFGGGGDSDSDSDDYNDDDHGGLTANGDGIQPRLNGSNRLDTDSMEV